MKRLFFFVLFCVLTGMAGAQQYSKFNQTLNRTEFFDRSGRLVGYSKYNALLKRTEFFDKTGRLVRYERDATQPTTDNRDRRGQQTDKQTDNNNSALGRRESRDRSGTLQSYEKWNRTLNRYDIYDRSGNLIGHRKYNALLHRWDYTWLKK